MKLAAVAMYDMQYYDKLCMICNIMTSFYAFQSLGATSLLYTNNYSKLLIILPAYCVPLCQNQIKSSQARMSMFSFVNFLKKWH